MKPGDKFRGKRGSIYNDTPRTVKFVGDTWVLYEIEGRENAITRTSFEKDFEPIPTFFEEGKTYLCDGGYRFTADAVREDGDGSRVAFGPHVGGDTPPTWALLSEWNWKHRGWREV